MDNRPIGVFDSGLGGLTVINALQATMPQESFIYVGDTARVPYGEKDIDTLRLYGKEILGFLREKDVKAVIVACGTISSNVMEDLQAGFGSDCDGGFAIIDVVRPGARACLKLENLRRVGVIATEATVKGGFFQKVLKEKSSNRSLEVDARACPLFVPLIEEGLYNHAMSDHIIKAYLHDWKENPVDAIILGCTHYPLLSSAIRRVLGDIVQIDMAAATLEETTKILAESSLLGGAGNKKTNEFYVSGDCSKFNEMSKKITGLEISAKKINWE